VAVTINKAMIEIPPKFAGRAPVGPHAAGEKQGKLAEDWSGATGLAEDVRRYGAWMRAEAEKRIGHLYPKVEITAEMAQGAPGPEAAGGPEAHRHRLAVGAHGQKPQPGLQPCRSAAGLDLSCCPARRARRRMWSRWSRGMATGSR
jgi:hypothetical protein